MFASFSATLVVAGGLVGIGQYDSRSQARWESLSRHVDVQNAQLNERITREVQIQNTVRENFERTALEKITNLEAAQRADDASMRRIIERLVRIETQNATVIDAINQLRDSLRRPAFVPAPLNQGGGGAN